MHRVKWRHRICGHDTIAILSVGRIKGRRFIVLFKLPSIRWFMKISVWSLARRQSVFQRYHSEKYLSQFYSQGGGERQLASKVRHCHPIYTTLAACSLAMCGLRTRPRTDVDPPRVELPSWGGISSRRPRGDTLFRCAVNLLPVIQQIHNESKYRSLTVWICSEGSDWTELNYKALTPAR